MLLFRNPLIHVAFISSIVKNLKYLKYAKNVFSYLTIVFYITKHWAT